VRLVLLTLASLVAGLALAATANADVVWLCKPGAEDNPCRDTLEATIYDTQGNSRVENPPLPTEPPIDCFYVYPTVSEQRGPNANKNVDPPIRAIAQYQASRFSQVCQVWAPMYRQQTLLALAQGGSNDALKLAYGDVEEAWREYVAKHNDGRGVALIGHSQGTRMLRQLLRREIEPQPTQLRRLVSALLLGGNVTVRKGQKVGGDFQRVPACTRAGEVGCVIAWSTFNETPPSNSRYGRAPAEDTSGFGFPAGPDYEVLCTNPASLAANERVPLSTYLRSEPFPGVIGALLVQMYGGPPPTAPTAFIQPQDHYTGRCEERDGANVLMLEPIDGARQLNPAPDPSWGLHLADGNIALGDLVDVVGEQAAAYGLRARARPGGKPRLRLRARGRRGATRRCMRGAVRVSLAGADLARVRHADYFVAGKLAARGARRPFRTAIPRARLRGRVIRRLVAFAQLEGGGQARVVRHVRICR
jgi:hypothetical protein